MTRSSATKTQKSNEQAESAKLTVATTSAPKTAPRKSTRAIGEKKSTAKKTAPKNKIQKPKAATTASSNVGRELPNLEVPDTETLVLEAARLGKDEINLILYPWFTLWHKEASDTIISREWTTEHGPCSWTVTGHPQLGLPTPQDLRVVLACMELTRESGLEQTVTFSRFNLLQRLNWEPTSRNYEMLDSAFHRLQGARIRAKNSFRQGKSILMEDVSFNIIDYVRIVKGRPGRKPKKPVADRDLPVSSFKWSDTLFESIQSGYLATLDLDFAFSIRNDVALALYRLLRVKTYHGNGTFQMELSEFYHRHLGLRPTPYASKMKERLKPAHEELIQVGYLSHVEYLPMQSRKGEKICYHLASGDSAVSTLRTLEEPLRAAQEKDGSVVDKEEKRPITGLLERLQQIGLDEAAARQVLAVHTEAQIALQLDCLDERQPRDRAAYFLYCLRHDIAPPASYLERLEQRRAQQAEDADNSAERETAREQAAQARSARDRREQSLAQARSFYDTLSDRARAVVRARIDVELNQFGERGRLLYPHPRWLEVLHETLRDENFAQSLRELADPDWDNLEEDSTNQEAEVVATSHENQGTQSSLFANLELYVQTLRELLQAREVEPSDPHSLRRARDRYFPLLDEDEWDLVRKQAEIKSTGLLEL